MAGPRSRPSNGSNDQSGSPCSMDRRSQRPLGLAWPRDDLNNRLRDFLTAMRMLRDRNAY